MQGEWYYRNDDGEFGPVTRDDIEAMARAGTLPRGAFVKMGRGGVWVHPSEHFYASTDPASPSLGPRRKGWALYIAWLCVFLFGFGAGRASIPDDSAALLLLLTVWMAEVSLRCSLLWRAWGCLQDGSARTSPALAVGLLFVPFFGLGWRFVAIHGLAKDLNAYARRHALPVAEVNQPLALISCILSICVLPSLLLLAWLHWQTAERLAAEGAGKDALLWPVGRTLQLVGKAAMLTLLPATAVSIFDIPVLHQIRRTSLAIADSKRTGEPCLTP